MSSQDHSIVDKRCLFCDGSQAEVKMLIVPGKDKTVGICDSCVKLCLDVMFKKHIEEVERSVSLEKQHDPEVLAGATKLNNPEAV